jgi:hypothetical protein
MLRRASLAFLMLAAGTAWAAPPTVPELLRLVPTDARAVVAVDAAVLRTAPLVEQWLLAHQAAWSRVDDDAARFLSEAGVDPARDVDYMMFALTGDQAAQHPLALLAGRYDSATLVAALQARGAVQVKVGTVTAYRVGHTGNADAQHAALIRVTPQLVMVGDRDTLLAAQDRASGPVRVVAAEKAAGHLDVSAPFWMAVAIPEDAAAGPHSTASGAESPGAQAMVAVAAASAAVRRVAAWATLGQELRLHAFATTASEENAGLLRDTVRGALAAMRLAVQEREPRVVDVLRGVKVDTEGAAVAVTAELPVDLLQQLAGEAHHHHAKVTEAAPR